jgi:hypothetical protein
MPPTRRINRQPTNTTEALAARLPDELKSFGLSTDMPSRTVEIAKWITAQKPRADADLVKPVMAAVGLTYLFSLRDRLTATPTKP